MIFKRQKADIDWIVAGLGNPGKKYEGTRHNVGFEALDYIAGKWGIDVRRAKFDSLCGTGRAGGHRVLLLKPQTFMNLSGTAIQKAAAFYHVPVQRVLVLFDDVSLAPGMLRIRTEGSAGGHNGLKSIITFMGQDFPRVKIGVGDRPRPEYDLADWVLSRFTQAEKAAISARYDDVAAAAGMIMDEDVSGAMSRYNGEGHTGRNP